MVLRWIAILLLLINSFHLTAQGTTSTERRYLVGKENGADSLSYYRVAKTYVNPVLPGDHPDPTLLKVGDDFYHCGSSFHFNPYLPIYHSKDLVHWKVISRVLPPAMSSMVTDKPSVGVWQGAITYFYGSYWIYFSSGGQWFSKASSPYGPWSTPVQVKTNSTTGPLGYDNSIFVDDDGKPYMVIKNMQKVNRIQALGKDGQLTDTVINLDWINAKLQYSWAEGPVMCKRNGYYYYFPAGDVSGGQYVLRASALTADSTKWERLGNFFKADKDPANAFRSPNHIAAPVQLADGTWWTIGQSYERTGDDDWSGMGRQTSLYQVIWEGDRPWGMPPVSGPVLTPGLPQSGISWRSVYADYFNSDALDASWHFLNKKAATSYSLKARKGWVRLDPDGGQTHLLQKETDHYYTAVTKLDMKATGDADKAGIYLANGDQKVFVMLYSGFLNGKKIILHHDSVTLSVPNSFGDQVWLKLERYEHTLTAWCSSNGKKWTNVGSINSHKLDKAQPNFNSWVGTSVGLFAEGKVADFDFFVCKDGQSNMPAIGYSNYYGVETVETTNGKMVTPANNNGGWFMLSGVVTGNETNVSSRKIEIELMADSATSIEVFADSLENGTPIATVSIEPTRGKVRMIKSSIVPVNGQHDIFVRFKPGSAKSVFIKSLRFLD